MNDSVTKMKDIRNFPAWPDGVEYCESNHLTHFGGFLLILGDYRAITMSTQLTAESWNRGVAYLLSILSDSPGSEKGLHIWVDDDPTEANPLLEEQDSQADQLVLDYV